MMVDGCWWSASSSSSSSSWHKRVGERESDKARERREKKNYIESYSNRAYMHGYCSNFAYK